MNQDIWISFKFKIAFEIGKWWMMKIYKWVLNQIYSKDQLSKDVHIIHTKNTVVEAIMQANVDLPMYKFSITIVNNSPYTIVLEKIPIIVWLNQPFCSETVNEVLEISSRSEKHILVTIFMNELQVKALKKLKNELPKICGTGYFQTPLGSLAVVFQQSNVAMNNLLSE